MTNPGLLHYHNIKQLIEIKFLIVYKKLGQSPHKLKRSSKTQKGKNTQRKYLQIRIKTVLLLNN